MHWKFSEKARVSKMLGLCSKCFSHGTAKIILTGILISIDLEFSTQKKSVCETQKISIFKMSVLNKNTEM